MIRETPAPASSPATHRVPKSSKVPEDKSLEGQGEVTMFALNVPQDLEESSTQTNGHIFLETISEAVAKDKQPREISSSDITETSNVAEPADDQVAVSERKSFSEKLSVSETTTAG